MQQQMRDPAAGVPRELLTHMHLVSKHRYPTLNQMSLDTVVSYLTEAPKIVHDLQPVVWQFLEAPPDGTVLLAWQPLDYLGTNFASDGYVWADAEHAFSSEHNGYIVEMWLHRGGYHWPNEPLTGHCRRRYRLTKSKNPAAPPFDPSLWIVHYSRADRDHIFPSNQIPLQPHVQTGLNQRRFLQNQGHLARKEFMLHDKANWPTINLPSAQGLQYPPHMLPRQPATPMQIGHSPMKNMQDRNPHRRGPSTVLEPTLEEEEDVSRGDLLDLMTPRDISRMRYEQHHEWMEEIMSSPFAMKQIVPTDLGLGRKGELEALTSGFFDTPTSVLQETSANASNARVGRMEVGKAEEFTAKAARKVAEMEAELQHLKKRHSRRMARVDKSSSLIKAEQSLRRASIDSAGRGIPVGAEAESGPSTATSVSVDDAVRDVEHAAGKKIRPVSEVDCVQRGGLEEKVQTPPRPTAVAGSLLPSTATIDSQMSGLTAAEAQAASPHGAESTAAAAAAARQPPAREHEPPAPAQTQAQAQVSRHHELGVQQQQQQPMVVAAAADPQQRGEEGEQEEEEEEEEQAAATTVPSLDDMDVDIEMAGLDEGVPSGGEQVGDHDGSDWVMVGDVGVGAVAGEVSASADDGRAGLAGPAAAAAAASGFGNTPTGTGLQQGLTPAAEALGGGADDDDDDDDDGPPGLTAADFDLGHGGFDDANLEEGVGEGLGDFGVQGGDLSLEGMGMGMGMDESAFGNAFHTDDEGGGHLEEGGEGGDMV